MEQVFSLGCGLYDQAVAAARDNGFGVARLMKTPHTASATRSSPAR
jgi:hypothetical protein